MECAGELVGLDGKTYTEKSYSAAQKIQFTPSLVFYDESGKVVLRPDLTICTVLAGGNIDGNLLARVDVLASLASVVYLVVMGSAGLWVAARRLDRILMV